MMRCLMDKLESIGLDNGSNINGFNNSILSQYLIEVSRISGEFQGFKLFQPNLCIVSLLVTRKQYNPSLSSFFSTHLDKFLFNPLRVSCSTVK